ncbi:hypothetical protein ABKV19_026400 [Rosa sericea]
MAGLGNDSVASLRQADSTLVALGDAGAAAFQDNRWYMVGRLLAPKAGFPGFKGTISTIWHLRSGLTIQEAGERFVFQFENESVRNRILHGGPWFYRNTMLVVGEYDGLCPPEMVALNMMETWVVVRGLPLALRNKVALNMVGATLGQVVRMDLTALKRKEEEQRIKVVFDVRRQIRSWKVVEFSPVVRPELTFIYEKVKGYCRDCGLFIHDVMGCDKTLIKEKEELLARESVAAMEGLSLTVGKAVGVSGMELESGQGGSDLVCLGAGSGSEGQGVGTFRTGREARAGVSIGVLPSKLMGRQLVMEPVLQQLKTHAPLLFIQPDVGSKALALSPVMNGSGKEKARVEFSSMQAMSNGRKRKARAMLSRFGKKILALPDSSLEVGENTSLVVQHKNGKLLVSPRKKKIGRPKGSKNKVKNTEDQDEKQIRKYRRRGKALCFDSTLEALAVAAEDVTRHGIMQTGEDEAAPIVESPVAEGVVEGEASPSTSSLI